jgi:hypothetical protein
MKSDSLVLFSMMVAVAGMRLARAAPPKDDLIDGVVARSVAVYQAQVDFGVREREGADAESLREIRSDRYQLTVSGTDWLLRYADSPNLMMKRDAATLRYYETDSPDGKRYRSLHLNAAQSLEDAQGQNTLFTVMRHGSFWYPAQATFVDRERNSARLVDQQTLAGVDTYALQWEVAGPDFDEALIVIPPPIARQRKGYLRIYVAPALGYVLPRIEYRTIDDTVVKRYESSDFIEADRGIFYPRLARCATDHADWSFSTEFRVHSIQHVNQQIPAETFAIRFPAKTRVRDSRPGRPKTVFLLEEPMGIGNLESILTCASPRPSWSILRKACLGLNAAAVLSLIVLWVRRQYSKHRRTCLITVIMPLVFTARGLGQPMTESTLQEVHQQIEHHQSLVRLCGPLSVIRAMSLLGHSVEVRSILRRYRGSQVSGVKLQQIIDLCRELDVSTRAVDCKGRGLRTLTFPCILLVNEGRHCIVLEDLVNQCRSAVVWDPSDLKRKTIPSFTVRQMWSGQAILFGPQPWSDSAVVLIAAGVFALTLAQMVHFTR